jgi:hypothetical protein
MSTAPPSLSLEALWDELWISLTSLLRSYAAAHGLSASRQPEVEATANRIVVRHHRHWLELDRAGTKISWRREDGRSGLLELTESGRLRGDSGEEEMDMAAEAWARDLVKFSEASR